MSAAPIEQYRRDGVLFPIPSLPADEAAQAQLYFRWAYELATHPRILALSTDAALAAQQAAARRLLTALRGTTGHYAAGDASR
jgi:hypothetical protein